MPAAVSQRHGLAFFSVPKSASTSMKMVLYELEHGRPWIDEPDRVHPQFPTYPITEKDFTDTKGFWRFTIIRDPVARLLSSYGNRVHHHQDIARAVVRRHRDRLMFQLRNPGLRLYPNPGAFFRDLARYQEISYSIWHHTVSVSTFIGTDLSRFDAIYRVDDLPELEAELSRRTGHAIALPREQTAGRKITLEMLPRPVRRAVLEHTRADYDLLRRYYTPPEAG